MLLLLLKKKMINTIKQWIKRRGEFIPIERINFNVEPYKPVRNRFKVGLVVAVFVGCICTPCTNWLILVTGRMLNKYPLWLYK